MQFLSITDSILLKILKIRDHYFCECKYKLVTQILLLNVILSKKGLPVLFLFDKV